MATNPFLLNTAFLRSIFAQSSRAHSTRQVHIVHVTQRVVCDMMPRLLSLERVAQSYRG
ncbi:hypothetical protein SANTM175S_04470 [Streptomyces antimycoticus]